MAETTHTPRLTPYNSLSSPHSVSQRAASRPIMLCYVIGDVDFQRGPDHLCRHFCPVKSQARGGVSAGSEGGSPSGARSGAEAERVP